jgi:hypothetical protein
MSENISLISFSPIAVFMIDARLYKQVELVDQVAAKIILLFL